MTGDVQAVALSPDQVPANITLQVEAVRPDGSRAPMIRLNTRADWDRRYWFERPLTLPRGTKIEVTANFTDPDRKSTRLNSSHANISYAVFCLKKKNTPHHDNRRPD